MTKKNKAKKQKIILAIISIITISVAFIAFYGYNLVFGSSITIEEGSKNHIIVPSDISLDSLCTIIEKDSILDDIAAFKFIAKKKNLQNHIHSGKYLLMNGMSINALINMIRSGNHEVVKLTFSNARTKEQLAGKLSKQIELDSLSILKLLRDPKVAKQFHSDTLNYYTHFIPNTYLVYWNISGKQLLQRMNREYESFWTQDRLDKAATLNMSREEIITLASIVQEETLRKDEKKRVAGVYINRLRKGIALQADPTIKFALQDFEKKRITKKDLKIKSPYNTYQNAGLPPGPINIPSINSIDAVLNYESHKYYYFCAKEDFSGYHNFAKTLLQHNINARKYHKALNRRKIYK